ncbi:MAG: hypothetical protein JWQ63_2154 [Mucilaginibacter sp.]|jgi:hypothetical protein|nr:hypothetical protein [Mucilaginibacter sp.]
MKKTFFFLVATILFLNIAQAQTGWINYKIDNKLSIKVPAEPTKLDENSVFVKTKDSSVYVIAVVDIFKLAGLDSATIASQSPTVEFANSFKNGMLGKMPGSTLGDVTIGKWKGYTCYNMDGGNASSKLKIYTFMLFIGTKVYSVMTILPENKNTKEKDAYFNSLVLN